MALVGAKKTKFLPRRPQRKSQWLPQNFMAAHILWQKLPYPIDSCQLARPKTYEGTSDIQELIIAREFLRPHGDKDVTPLNCKIPRIGILLGVNDVLRNQSGRRIISRIAGENHAAGSERYL